MEISFEQYQDVIDRLMTLQRQVEIQKEQQRDLELKLAGVHEALIVLRKKVDYNII